MSNLQNQVTNLLSSLCVIEVIYRIILKVRHLARFSCDWSLSKHIYIKHTWKKKRKLEKFWIKLENCKKSKISCVRVKQWKRRLRGPHPINVTIFRNFFFLNGLKSATGFQLDHQHDKELRKMAGNAKTIYLAILSNFVKSAIAWLLIHSTTWQRTAKIGNIS